MRMRLTVTGDKELMKHLNRLGPKAVDVGKAVLLQAGDELVPKIKAQTPVDPDGSGQKNLTNNPDHDSYHSWSGDGKKIAFISGTARGGGEWDIYVMNPDGSEKKRLTLGFTATHGIPLWSPLMPGMWYYGGDEIWDH